MCVLSENTSDNYVQRKKQVPIWDKLTVETDRAGAERCEGKANENQVR